MQVLKLNHTHIGITPENLKRGDIVIDDGSTMEIISLCDKQDEKLVDYPFHTFLVFDFSTGFFTTHSIGNVDNVMTIRPVI